MKTLLLLALSGLAQAAAPCRIEVIDAANGWPVPLVELRTVHHQRFVTDNAGVIAIDSPELMGQLTWFDVRGHGYGVAKDGFGFSGVRLTPEPGTTLKVKVTRRSIAQRLGRLTGAGLFAESQRFGQYADWEEAGIFGCDSVQNAVHNGRLYWAWGDSNLPGYPLGIFDTSSATTPIQPLKSFEPPIKLKLYYFRDDKGKPRGVAKMPGKGPTWVSGYVSVPDATGKARLVGSYVKVQGFLDVYETGLCVWNEKTESFEPHRKLWTRTADAPKPPPMPQGHPAFWTDENGQPWLLFGDPLPTLRCKPSFEAWQDPGQWETLKPQTHLDAAESHEKVKLHTGSIAWNAFRKRWVTVFMQHLGKPSAHGELWYAEALQPLGPWGPAIKVLSHDNYTFYNPRLHPEFTPAESPALLFEGTYTTLFADHAEPTPRYDYNQVLYRLDLDDPRLKPAQLP